MFLIGIFQQIAALRTDVGIDSFTWHEHHRLVARLWGDVFMSDIVDVLLYARFEQSGVYRVCRSPACSLSTMP